MNATVYLQEQLLLQHDEGQKIYENTGTMAEPLKNHVIYTDKNMLLKELKNNYIIFLGVMCRDIIEHILSRCGKIKTVDL